MVLWVGTSFKMNKTVEEALAFARRLAHADRERDVHVQRFV
ncbi:triose-phosphate isomerase, partial [Mesorhizobium sp. M1A.T.Ca.IN.004.03.1.1]